MVFSEEFYSSIICKECFGSKKQTEAFFRTLFDLLFQTGGKSIDNKDEINLEFLKLKMELKILIKEAVGHISDEKTNEIADHFFTQIPVVYELLNRDAEFIDQSDPASNSIREVEVAYPGFFAIAAYRFANVLYKLNLPYLPRILTEYAHHNTGVDIHPGATIGSPFMIDHGTGVVIGETTNIGSYVKIFQGVTLGALSVSIELKNKKRHPTIEDHVVIYAGATILGGNTIVGENCTIGGNVWLTESVDPNCKIFNKSQVVVKK